MAIFSYGPQSIFFFPHFSPQNDLIIIQTPWVCGYWLLPLVRTKEGRIEKCMSGVCDD